MKLAKSIALIASALVLSVSVGTTASAAELDGAKLFKKRTCWACHGKDAKTPTPGQPYPKLAGQNADYAFAQMKDIKSGVRNNGKAEAMKAVMHLVTEEEMRAIADWIATLPYK